MNDMNTATLTRTQMQQVAGNTTQKGKFFSSRQILLLINTHTQKICSVNDSATLPAVGTHLPEVC